MTMAGLVFPRIGGTGEGKGQSAGKRQDGKNGLFHGREFP
jgi:hypothetical protein